MSPPTNSVPPPLPQALAADHMPVSDFMGYSVRTAQWRYTAWYHWNKKALVPHWDGSFAEELYNHTGDHSTGFDRWDNVNLAPRLPHIAQKLRQQLKAFFRDNAESYQ